MTDATTVNQGRGWLKADRAAHREMTALVIAWSMSEPERIGQAALLPDGALPRLLGRGGGSAEDAHARLSFFRQRPGSLEATEPLAGRGLSRNQLLISPSRAGLKVENLGRTALFHNGIEVAEARVVPGDTLLVQDQLLLLCVRRAGQYAPVRAWPEGASGAFGEADEHGIVGESEATWRLREQIAFNAARDAHVLVLGGSGAGKELVARAVHDRSGRAGRTLVSRNAATIPEGLIDAELFGNVRDYPNPGMRERRGLIGEADHSTLFLDEIGELPVSLQAHLLRVLDAGGEYQRLGESHVRNSNLRVIAATNRDPSELKHDLVARLTLRIEVDGLPQRREDVPLLARALLRATAAEDPALGERFFEGWDGQGGGVPRIDPLLMEGLCRHQYTLHVRELRSLLWRAMATSTGHFIARTDAVQAELKLPTPEFVPAADLSPERIREVLVACGGNQSKAYKVLGLKNRDVLYRLIKKYNITVSRED